MFFTGEIFLEYLLKKWRSLLFLGSHRCHALILSFSNFFRQEPGDPKVKTVFLLRKPCFSSTFYPPPFSALAVDASENTMRRDSCTDLTFFARPLPLSLRLDQVFAS